MSVAYEPRSFINEGAYPSMGDDDDHDVAEQRYTDSDVAEHLGHYTAEASILDDEPEALADDGGIAPDDDDDTTAAEAAAAEGIVPDDDDDTTAAVEAAAAVAATVAAAAAAAAAVIGPDDDDDTTAAAAAAVAAAAAAAGIVPNDDDDTTAAAAAAAAVAVAAAAAGIGPDDDDDTTAAAAVAAAAAAAGIVPDDDDDTTAALAAAAAAAAHDEERLDLTLTFPSPIHVPLATSLMGDEGPLDSNDLSPDDGSPSSVSRNKLMSKPDRDIMKQKDGKYHCPLPDCREEVNTFSRKCEWNKHMDKHERPYRCPAEGCESLPGFTYSGGLLRHEREVHGKHGGPKNTVNCPHPNCKRHTGKGFSRQENLNEHLRRVHTNMDGSTPPAAESAASPEDNESEHSGAKRKRRQSDVGNDETSELRDEVKRLREENVKLKVEMEQQSEQSLTMMAQLAELQETLRQSLAQQGLGAPTAQMI